MITLVEPNASEQRTCRPCRWGRVTVILLLVLAAYTRINGLYRGLDEGVQFHPDVAKQVIGMGHFMAGHLVWYTGARAFDGYPLLLMRMNAGVLRGVHAVEEGWAELTSGAVRKPPEGTLIYLTRWVLRMAVLYGLAVVGLGYGVARGLRLSWPARLAMLFILAVAPVAVAVGHFATGDIAVDFFLTLMLVFMVWHARQGSWWAWPLAGGMVGFAFAGKYNGIMGGAGLAVYAALWAAWRPRPWRDLVLAGVLALAGCAAAVLVAMPQLLFATKRTLHDLGRILEFIRIYGVPPEFYELPWWERIVTAVRANAVKVLGALGWSCTLTGALALPVMACLTWGQRVAWRDAAPEARRVHVLKLAILVMPWLILAVGLGGKPRLHPFQFSFLQLPLALGWAIGVHALWQWRAWTRVVAALLILGAVVEFGARVDADRFFWARDDVEQVTNGWVEQRLLQDVRSKKHRYADDLSKVLRELVLEPGGPSHFRNRPRRVLAGAAATWTRHASVPVPRIPFDHVTDWVFLNGPPLPRSDRLRRVEAFAAVRWYLVSFETPTTLPLILRTGRLPAQVELTLGGVRREVTLGSDQQEVLWVKPSRWRNTGPGETGRTVRLVPLDVSTRVGPVWVTMPASSAEAASAQLLGGGAWDDAIVLPDLAGAEALAQLTRAEPYHAGGAGGVPVEGPLVLACRLPLAAGIYRLDVDLRELPEGAVLHAAWFDDRGYTLPTAEPVACPADDRTPTLSWRLTKPFAPYEIDVVLGANVAGCVVERWALRPDIVAMTEALRDWRAGGVRPEWLRRYPEGLPPAPEPLDACFGKLATLRGVRLIAAGRGGRDLNLQWHFDLQSWPRNLDEYDVFVHVCDPSRQLVYAEHVRLHDVVFGDAQSPFRRVRLPDALAPGMYGVWTGIYNRRTLRNQRIRHVAHARDERVETERVQIGLIEVAP